MSLSELYTSQKLNRPPHLKPLQLQYKDFCHRPLQKSEWKESQLDYWATKLEEIPETSTFPTNYKRPLGLSYEGGDCSIELDVSLFENNLNQPYLPQ